MNVENIPMFGLIKKHGLIKQKPNGVKADTQPGSQSPAPGSQTGSTSGSQTDPTTGAQPDETESDPNADDTDYNNFFGDDDF